MARFQDFVTDQSGATLPGAFVTVRNYPSGALTAITDDLGAAKANPITADGLGAYYFNAPSGLYTLEFRLVANEVARKIREVDLSDTLRSDLIGGNGHTFLWGVSPPAWDGVSDRQAFFVQTQPTFLPNGSLGAIFGERLATYTGGAADDASSPATGAVRGYTQVSSGVTFCNESGGLFVTDNLSYMGQGLGIFGQANSLHGGRAWGGVLEAKELPETFTATAGQTVFAVPNGFNSVGAVTKNGTILTVVTNYTAVSPNVTLTVPASAGDVIKVYRGDPQNSPMGAEIDVYAAAGNDTTNAISGNRIGLGIFGYRVDKSFAASTHIGTLLNIVVDPADASLSGDRGILFQGRFGTGIDFTASNFTASNWLLKFGSAHGVNAAGIVILKTSVVASLPVASASLKGARMLATDLSGATFTYGAAAAGGGSRGGPVFCDGSAWKEG